MAWMERTGKDGIVDGVPIYAEQAEKVVWKNQDDRIVVVTPSSQKIQQDWAREVCQVAMKDVPHESDDDFPENYDWREFVYCRGVWAVGLLILERRTHAKYLTWDEYDTRRIGGCLKAGLYWSVAVIWALKKYRCGDIAKRLLDESVLSLGIELENVVLQPPFTSEGRAFAMSVFPKGFLV